MKKILAFIISLLLISSFSLADEDGLVGAKKRGASTPSCNTSNIIFFHAFETKDADYSTASVTGTLNGSAAINTDAVKYGTNGLDIPVSESFDQFVSPAVNIDEEGKFGIWIRITDDGDGNQIFGLEYSTDYIRLVQSGSTELSFVWRDNDTDRTPLTTTTASMAHGTWYFIEIAWKVSTNYREIWVDGASKGSSSETIGALSGDVATMNVGDSLSPHTIDWHLDNAILSNVSTDDIYTYCKDMTSWPE